MDTNLEHAISMMVGIMRRKLTPRRALMLMLAQEKGSIRNGDVIQYARCGTALISNDIVALKAARLLRDAKATKGEADKRHSYYELTTLGRETIISLVARG